MTHEKLVVQIQRILDQYDELTRALALAGPRADHPLQGLSGAFARERVDFCEDLGALVVEYGGAALHDPVARGTLRRAVEGMRGIFHGRSEDALFAVCLRREQSLMRLYEETCEWNLPIGVADVLMRHYTTIKRLHYDWRDHLALAAVVRRAVVTAQPQVSG